jgi:hypothetical protein
MHFVTRIVLCLGMLPGIAPAARADNDALARLAWLAGCWANEGGEAGSGEQWMAPAGGTLLGIGRTVKSGKTVTYEFMQIRETEPGKLVFIARPSGQAEGSFAAIRQDDVEIVFENPKHDFPQRIVYRHENPEVPRGDALRAYIEGHYRGVFKRIEFPMRRTACGPSTLQEIPKNQ